MNPTIGVIGQGFIGKTYADNFERRGYKVERYSLDMGDWEKIQRCDIVFIAVPTPTVKGLCDITAVTEALALVGTGKVAVIKSTVIMGTTAGLQKVFPHITLLHSPEFLSERTADADVAKPDRIIVGMAEHSDAHILGAMTVIKICPQAGFEMICASGEAELIKYVNNLNGFFQVMFTNLMFDTAEACNLNFDAVKRAMAADPKMSKRYLEPVDSGGRGAGGRCFIKDFDAFMGMAKEKMSLRNVSIFHAMRQKNLELLKLTQKDQEIVALVTGGNRDYHRHSMPQLSAAPLLDAVQPGATDDQEHQGVAGLRREQRQSED